jgi:trimethylamine--corrinoid protein Co-methyltransferase
MFQRTMLQAADVDKLADAVLTTLEEVGILCQNQELLAALADFGARVDFGAETARFPREVTADFIAAVRGSTPPEDPAPRAFTAPGVPGLGTQVAQFVMDWGAGETRSGNRADFIELIKLGNSLHGQSGVGHCLLMTDVPPILEPLEAGLLLAEYADHPHGVFAWNVRQADYLIEMGEILGNRNWYSFGANCFAHPLRFDRDVADRFVRRVRAGETAGFTAMPAAGVSAPVTAAGFITVTAAELVATWMLGRAINPNCGLGGSIWGATVDMKTGEVSYNTFDAMFFAFGVSEFLRRWTGRELPVGGGEYSDARVPGYFAAYEKAYKALLIAAFSGRHPSIGQGMLDKGRILCPVQLLLERDLAVGCGMLAGPIEVSEDTLALDSILEVGFGIGQNHLGTEHTVRHFREALWCPALMERTPWEGEAKERRTLERLQAKVQDLIASYRKPERDPAVLEQLRQVVARARKDLVG